MQHFLRQESVHLYDAVMHYGHTVIDLINKRDDPYNASLVIQSMRNTTFRSESRDRDTFFVFLSIGLFYTNTVPDCQSGSAWASQGSAWASQRSAWANQNNTFNRSREKARAVVACTCAPERGGGVCVCEGGGGLSRKNI